MREFVVGMGVFPYVRVIRDPSRDSRSFVKTVCFVSVLLVVFLVYVAFLVTFDTTTSTTIADPLSRYSAEALWRRAHGASTVSFACTCSRTSFSAWFGSKEGGCLMDRVWNGTASLEVPLYCNKAVGLPATDVAAPSVAQEWFSSELRAVGLEFCLPWLWLREVHGDALLGCELRFLSPCAQLLSDVAVASVLAPTSYLDVFAPALTPLQVQTMAWPAASVFLDPRTYENCGVSDASAFFAASGLNASYPSAFRAWFSLNSLRWNPAFQFATDTGPFPPSLLAACKPSRCSIVQLSNTWTSLVAAVAILGGMATVLRAAIHSGVDVTLDRLGIWVPPKKQEPLLGKDWEEEQ